MKTFPILIFDIDILYRFSTQTIRLRQLMGFKEYLEELLGINIDLINPSTHPYIENDMILMTTEPAVA